MRLSSGGYGSGEPHPPPPPPVCKLSLPVPLRVNEPEICLTSREVDVLAQADTEYLWRFGFRRIVPGADEDVRRALKPLRKVDTLLTRYLERWPKQEERYVPPPWANDEAESAELEIQRIRGGGEV